MKKNILILIALAAAVLVAGCASYQATSSPTSSGTTSYSVMASTKEGIGNYLADSKGMTFYYFKRDTVGTSTSNPLSACTANCLTIWPVFYSANIVATSGISTSDFTSFTRADGIMQTAYKGWPLYYYYTDKISGDTNGQGINNVWYVVTP